MPARPAKPLVYLETSFISYLTARVSSDEKTARWQAATRLWWEQVAPACDLFVSDTVSTTLPITCRTILEAGYDCPAIATPEQRLEESR